MGAHDTFDAGGYVALLRRLRDATEDVVYAPEFRREIEEPVNAAVAVALRVLIARHIEFGKDAEFAREWVMRSDQRNAELIATTQRRADALVRVG